MKEGSASSSSSSSSSFWCGWNYDVFLSFNREDGCNDFARNLHDALWEKGIRTFLCDEALTTDAAQEIRESRIAIVIFSENYASSPFCLQQLVQIVDCFWGIDRFICPLFYRVDPSDVQHRTGSCNVAFDYYERFFDDELVKSWRLALNLASYLAAWHVDPSMESYEHEIMEGMIREISGVIDSIPLHVAEFPVGIESRVKEILSLLNEQLHSDGAFGIYGIGGVGKSTLARALYNLIASQSAHFCFLHKRDRLWSSEDFLDVLEECMGTDELQATKSLPSSLRVWKYYPFTLRSNFSRTNLAIMDLSQQSFQWGNLRYLKLEHIENLMEVPDMSGASNLKELSVAYCKNLTKFGRSVGHHANLRALIARGCTKLISFLEDGINLPSLEILDLTGCSNFRKFPEILGKMENIKTLALSGTAIETLPESVENLTGLKRLFISDCRNLCLIPVDSICKLTKLVRLEAGSRVIFDWFKDREGQETGDLAFWNSSSINLNYNYISDQLLAVILGWFPTLQVLEPHGIDFTVLQACIEECRSLKRLYIDRCKQLQEIRGIPPDIKILSAVNCTSLTYMSCSGALCQELLIPRNRKYMLPELLIPRNRKYMLPGGLVSQLIHMDEILISHWWRHLHYLNIERCDILTELPDLSRASNLKLLSVTHCKDLMKICSTAGHHANLRALRVRGCTKLVSFLEDGINFTSLEILDLTGCSSFRKFPEILGKMENVKTLALSGTAIETLPQSIENLTGLECLYLYNCRSLCQIPVDNIRKLTKLVRLEAGSCGIFNWFKDHKAQRTVNLAFWNITRLHLNENNISDQLLAVILRWFPMLQVLELRGNDFTVLPACIEECRSLKRLYLDRCKQLHEIRGIPPNIKILSAVNCTSLTYVSCSSLLSQVPGDKRFILPGGRIPEWIHCCKSGSSVSLQVRNGFPKIAICVVFDVRGRGSSCFEFTIRVLLNDTHSFDVKTDVLDIESGHIYLFDDLRHQNQEFELKRGLLVKKFNDVRISCSARHKNVSSDAYSFVKYIGVYVYNYESCKDDIQFENPRRTLEDMICDEDCNFSIYSDSSREDRLYYKDFQAPEAPEDTCGGGNSHEIRRGGNGEIGSKQSGNKWHKWLCVIVSSVVLYHYVLHLLWLIHQSLGCFLSFVGYMEQ